MKKELYLVTLFIAGCASGGVSWEKEENCYCVTPENGTETCGTCKSKCCPLSCYVNNSSVLHNDSTFYFLPGEHYLDKVWRLNVSGKMLMNVSLVASCNDTLESEVSASITCGGSVSGLIFQSVYGLRINGLNFLNCGNITSRYESRKMVSALLLINVWDLSMTRVEIHNSSGWGMYCYLILGNSHISHSTVRGGHYTGNQSGGNIRFKYEDDQFNDTSDNGHTLVISDTVIETGAENMTDYKAYAGGIDIYLITRKRINMTFVRVKVHNNSGYDGGNMAITYTTLDNGWKSSVSFINCTFSNGLASHHGGGLFVEPIQKTNGSIALLNKTCLMLEVINTNFIQNTAKLVGGGLFLQVHENQLLSTIAHITLRNCTFKRNRVSSPTSAQGGAAVHIVNYKLPGSVPHSLPQYNITFENCYFFHNGPTVRNESSLGCGVLYIAENALTVLKDVNISDNTCTGIAAAQSTIVMQGVVTIRRNHGFNGGGILLCANALMFTSENVQIFVQENRTENNGGGIYAQFECTQAYPPCFYGTSTNQTSVYLDNNNASKAGDAVYGGAIDYCYTAPNSLLEEKRYRVKFDELFNITQSNYTTSMITSDPYQVCICSSPHCFNSSHCQPVTHFAVYPGYEIYLHVVVVGQRSGTAPGVVRAAFTSSDFRTSLGDRLQQSQNVSSSCGELRYKILTYIKKNETLQQYNTSLSLFVANGDFEEYSPSTFSPAYINLTVQQCPHGFGISDKVSHCHCLSVLTAYLDDVKCNIQSMSISREKTVNWWLSFDKKKLIFSLYCPFDFCKNSNTMIIERDRNSSYEKQCAFNRTGILCGACRDGLSNVLGSSSCNNCRSFKALKIFGLTVLFAIAGILLILFIGTLNLNVTEGAINPVIFYMNIVRINRSLFFDSCNNGSYCVEDFLGVFVAWMNLDLEIDTCYYDGMSAVGKTALQFVFPFYLWILAGLIIYFSHHFQFVSRIAGKNSVKLLATIILLSYAKIIRTIIDIVWQLNVYELNHSQEVVHFRTVWKMNGNVHYFDRNHGILFIFGAIVVFFTLPYTLSLLFIQCLKKKSHYKVLFWVVKLKPFFDAYTGPYRDKFHFWTGFLLLVRIALFAAIANNTNKGPILNLTLVCITSAILFLLNQPGVYKSWYLSLTESFTYFNLILFSIGTAYVLQQKLIHSGSHNTKGYHKEKVVLVCIGSMFLLFCGIVSWNVFKILRSTPYWEQLKLKLQERKWPWRKRRSIRPLLLRNSATDSSSCSSSEDELDPILHNAPPVARYDQFREPLVEIN